jgi:hypothetical protein
MEIWQRVTCSALRILSTKELVTWRFYEGVSKSFRTESITKYALTFGITRWEATQRVMAAKLSRLTHKIAVQLHLVAKSCTICSSRTRRPVWKLLDMPTYIGICHEWYSEFRQTYMRLFWTTQTCIIIRKLYPWNMCLSQITVFYATHKHWIY